jgi:hypothetical protein
MSKRTIPDLKELFKQASEIAQQVPESMQEAAFNRAIDLLAGGGKEKSAGESSGSNKESNRQTPKKTEGEEGHQSENDLLSVIDSTQHPGVASASKVIDRALMVLQIALNDHGVDGLTAGEVAEILTEKFRVTSPKNSVRMALRRAPTLVNRVTSDSGHRYRIMAPGEEYLAHLGESEAVASPTKKRSKKTSKPKTKKARKKARKKAKKVSKRGGNKTRTRASIGPKAAIVSLIESGFFSKSRTGSEVQARLKNKRGFTFGIEQLRLVLLRLVRDERLDRDENAEGQYEYTKSDN